MFYAQSTSTVILGRRRGGKAKKARETKEIFRLGWGWEDGGWGGGSASQREEPGEIVSLFLSTELFVTVHGLGSI